MHGHRYRGLVDERGWTSVVIEEAVDDGEGLISELPLRLDLEYRSPSGFSWGYGGAGPGQLCCALLAHILGVPERVHVLSMVEREQVIAEREAKGEDWHVVMEELNKEEREKMKTARASRIFLDDGSELLAGGEQLEQQGLRLVFHLYGRLHGDIVGRLPQRTPWIIEAADLLEWIRAPEDQRSAIGERIVRAAVRAGRQLKRGGNAGQGRDGGSRWVLL